MTAPRRAASRSLPWAVLSTALVAVFLFLQLPGWWPSFRLAGLDGSWMATLDHFALSDVRFGRDLVYTFGPLGFLASQSSTPDTRVWQLAWDLLRVAALSGVFWSIARRGGGAWHLLSAAGFCLLILANSRNDASLLVVAVALLGLAAGRGARRPGLLAARGGSRPGAGLLDALLVLTLAIGALTKIVHLAIGLWVVCAVALARWIDARRLSLLPLVYLAIVVVLWRLAGQPLAGWGDYLRNGWEIVAGYAEAMAQRGPAAEPLAALAGAVLVAAVWWHAAERSLRRWLLAAAVSGLLFVAFKMSFVRFGGARVAIAWQVIAVGAAVGWAARQRSGPPGRRSALAGALAVGLCLAGVVGAARLHAPGHLGSHLHTITSRARRALQAMRANPLDLGRIERQRRKAWRQIAARHPLPALRRSVDFFGNSSQIPIAHQLDYRPRPIFQSFAAYTPRLARLNGEFYRGPRAPQVVVAGIEPHRGSPAGFQDGEALLELFQSYAFKARHRDLLVLRRAHRRRAFDRRSLPERRVPLGSWVSLEELAGAEGVWAEIETPKTPAGALAEAALRLPPLEMTVRFADGRQRSFWFGTKRGAGFLLSPVIYGAWDLRSALRRGLGRQPPGRVVTAFRVAEAGGGRSWSRRGLVVRLAGLSSDGRLPRPPRRARATGRHEPADLDRGVPPG